jgi:hypothetical protein
MTCPAAPGADQVDCRLVIRSSFVSRQLSCPTLGGAVVPARIATRSVAGVATLQYSVAPSLQLLYSQPAHPQRSTSSQSPQDWAARGTIDVRWPQWAAGAINAFCLLPASGKACHAVGPTEADLRRGRTSSFAEAMADKSASSVEPPSSTWVDGTAV